MEYMVMLMDSLSAFRVWYCLSLDTGSQRLVFLLE